MCRNLLLDAAKFTPLGGRVELGKQRCPAPRDRSDRRGGGDGGPCTADDRSTSAFRANRDVRKVMVCERDRRSNFTSGDSSKAPFSPKADIHARSSERRGSTRTGNPNGATSALQFQENRLILSRSSMATVIPLPTSSSLSAVTQSADDACDQNRICY